MKLEGIITDGLGVAKFFVNKVNKVFLEKTGIVLFPGTLNIKLTEPYIVKPDFIIKKEEFNATQNVLVQKCRILNTDAYIVRAEKNQKGTRRT